MSGRGPGGTRLRKGPGSGVDPRGGIGVRDGADGPGNGAARAGDAAGTGTPSRGPAVQTRQIRGSSLLLAGTVLSSAVDFVSQVLLVRYLSKDAFGAWSYALALVVLFAGIAQLEMRNASSRFIPIYLERREPAKLLGTIALALGVAAGLGILIAGALVGGIEILHLRPTNDPQSLQLLLLVVLLVPIQAVDTVFTGLFAAFGASRTIFIRQSVLAPALRLGLVATLIAVHAGVSFLAVGYVAASLVGVLLYVASFRGVLRVHDLHLVGPQSALSIPAREVLAFAAPLLTSTLVWTLMESSDAILLGFFRNPEAVANFRVVLPLARMNGIVSSVFSVMFLPLAARTFERGDRTELGHLYWRTALWMTVLTFPILLATMCFASTVTTGIYGQAYASSAPILALLAAGYFFNTALGFNGLTLKVHGRLRYTVSVDVAMAIVNVAVNLLLIPRLGPIGAAIGTAATLFLHNVVKQIGVRRYTRLGWFPRAYVGIYLWLAAIAIVLALAQTVLPRNLIVAAVGAGLGGLLGLWVSRRFLELDTYFPELARVPLPAWVAAFVRPGGRDASGQDGRDRSDRSG